MTERQDGLLLAISRVKPGQITPAAFEEWYNDVHVADVLKTSGINSAARYHASGTTPDSQEWPFLALYPVPDVAFLVSAEFTSVPIAIESDLQTGKTCFDVAEFDIRQHRAVVDVHAGEVADGPAANILLVEFDPDVPESELGKIVAGWLQGAGNAKDAPRRATVHKLTWSLNHPGEKLKELPAYLAAFEFGDDENVYQDAIKEIQSVGKVRQWKLNKAFP
ncbi:uncharacterized protein BDV14DRAFT_198997 [Aspergillus stella-maris]|uniref:uncharacterized protein n=1 Tax=Aspergillus stella-maris TaxID=1810926 RepID=UPI003CCD98E7